MDLSDEIWKSIKGYEGIYEISNLGRVKAVERIQNKRNRLVKEHYLKPSKDTSGYWQVFLWDKGKKAYKLHRLLGEAFIPNPDNKPCINHINGNKADNRIENLEWCTYQENTQHAWKTGLCSKEKYNHYQTKVNKLDDNGNIIKTYNSQKEACICNGIKKTALNNCLKGLSKKTGGYKWEYCMKEEA